MLLRALLLSLLASAAQAACPSGLDVRGTGVWLTTDDGGVTHFLRDANDEVMETTLFSDGTGVWIRSHRGVFVVEDGSVADGKRSDAGRTLYAYGTDLNEIRLPGRNAHWEGELRRTNVDTGKVEIEAFSYRAKLKQNLVIGECEYYAVLFRTEFVRPDGSGYATLLHFIPDLGISLLAGGGLPGQEPDISYTYLGISAEHP